MTLSVIEYTPNIKINHQESNLNSDKLEALSTTNTNIEKGWTVHDYIFSACKLTVFDGIIHIR